VKSFTPGANTCPATTICGLRATGHRMTIHARTHSAKALRVFVYTRSVAVNTVTAVRIAFPRFLGYPTPSPRVFTPDTSEHPSAFSRTPKRVNKPNDLFATRVLCPLLSGDTLSRSH
jgi:hypothetical protein